MGANLCLSILSYLSCRMTFNNSIPINFTILDLYQNLLVCSPHFMCVSICDISTKLCVILKLLVTFVNINVVHVYIVFKICVFFSAYLKGMFLFACRTSINPLFLVLVQSLLLTCIIKPDKRYNNR